MEAHVYFFFLLAFWLLGLLMAMAVEYKRFYMLVLAKERDTRLKICSLIAIIILSEVGGIAGIVVGSFFYSIAPPTFSTLAIAPAAQEGLGVGISLGFVGLASFLMTGKTIESLGKRLRRFV